MDVTVAVVFLGDVVAAEDAVVVVVEAVVGSDVRPVVYFFESLAEGDLVVAGLEAADGV